MAQNVELKFFIESIHVTPDIFVTSWALSLFSHIVPLEYSGLLWSLILKRKWTGFVQIIAAIIKVFHDDIISCKDLAEFTKIFSKLSKPTQHHEYAVDVHINSHSLECFQLWEKIFIFSEEIDVSDILIDF